jgi:carboxylesterase type B
LPNVDFPLQVFVSLSYRLNAFGFLSWEDEVLPGNLGLLDQYLAILWVYENIGTQ